MAETSQQAAGGDRRQFLKESSTLVAGAALAGTIAFPRAVHAFGDQTIRIGLIGSGGRGTGAVDQIFQTPGPTKLVAVADAFQDRISGCIDALTRTHGDKVDVPSERQFAGFDGYQGVLQSEIDLVVLATPPGFRPLHFEESVQSRKHVFMEKPVAVDAPGVQRVLQANKLAKANNLMVAVGLQRHHEPNYIETIQRLQDGAIGDIVLGRAYWNSGTLWVRERKPEWTEMEYQMRNWYYFNWLCGDHIVEQHIHNIDVINWLMKDYPISANGQGGREVRRGPDHGQIYDHHFVEFTYPNGTKMLSQCRHIDGCWNSVSEFAHGTKGSADISGARILAANGSPLWSYQGKGVNGHQQEQTDMIASLRRGEIYNEGDNGAMSTMTAVLGRMATYSGQLITMSDALQSTLVEAPVDGYHGFDDLPPVVPDRHGDYPIPVPGRTVVMVMPAVPEASVTRGRQGSAS